jgi:sulfur-carrier protein adenylyltransferase/sulfurtransferase
MSLPPDFLRRISRAGAWAPSGDNLQPWSFASDGDNLLVRHDPTRDRSLFNVRQMASLIALGSVLENIVIAASKQGYNATLDYFPDSTQPDVVARIGFELGAALDPLAVSIEKRCTNRRPYEQRSVDPAFLRELEHDVGRYPGIELSTLHEAGDLRRIGSIVARADRLLFENRPIHDHLFSTLRWNAEEVERTRDGLPVTTLELGALGAKAFRALRSWSLVQKLNRFGLSKVAAGQSAMLMRRCSAAGLLTAPDTSPLSFLQIGRAFQRIWLLATHASLAFQPMTAVVFIQLRAILGDYEGLTAEQITLAGQLRQDLAGAYSVAPERIPAMHFRIGYAPPPSGRTIRREN